MKNHNQNLFLNLSVLVSLFCLLLLFAACRATISEPVQVDNERGQQEEGRSNNEAVSDEGGEPKIEKDVNSKNADEEEIELADTSDDLQVDEVEFLNSQESNPVGKEIDEDGIEEGLETTPEYKDEHANVLNSLGQFDTITISPSSFNQTIPDGILQELLVYVGGGGSYGTFCDDPKPEPALDYGPEIAEWLGEIYISTCGWLPEETVYITVHRPDGQTEYFEGNAYEYGQLEYFYHMHFDVPPGEYRFVFEGITGGKVTFSSNAVPLEGPHLYNLGFLFFDNFQPNEQVRLFVYGPSEVAEASFYGWHDLRVNADGELKLQFETADPDNDRYKNGYHVAIGEQSGEVFGVKLFSGDFFNGIESSSIETP